MRRSVFFLIQGMFYSSLVISAISVYLFHDVSPAELGHLHDAFSGLVTEGALFSLVVGGAVGILASIGRFSLGLGMYSSRAIISLYLGACVMVAQYPWEFVARKILPRYVDVSRVVYIIVAVAVCSLSLLWDTFRQMKRQASLDMKVDRMLEPTRYNE